jgi:hypothetical protein
MSTSSQSSRTLIRCDLDFTLTLAHVMLYNAIAMGPILSFDHHVKLQRHSSLYITSDEIDLLSIPVPFLFGIILVLHDWGPGGDAAVFFDVCFPIFFEHGEFRILSFSCHWVAFLVCSRGRFWIFQGNV